jgi:DmsE family decaheme c-type cytochrome
MTLTASWRSWRGAAPWIAVLLILAISMMASVVHAQNTFKLKPGAAGKVCFDCHGEFQEKLKASIVHAPVKTGECSGCHSPHTSAHGKLLSASPSDICTTCHADIIPAKAASTHKVAVEGKCVTCHDPHASNTKGLLIKAGNDLCVSCHKAVGDTVAKAKFKHMPVSDNCLSCHNPHGSAQARHLLTKTVPALCIECHDPASASFGKQHVNYPVARADCTSCHDVHGSNTAGILFDTVHAPVAAKRCNQCHNAATAPEPFATRRGGFELCRGCHTTMMNDTLAKSRVHWPLMDKTGCLNCHEAHASKQKKLINVSEATLCARCHTDTAEYQVRLAEKAKQEKPEKSRVQKGTFTHEPIQSGSCSACHSPHASDNGRLMRQASAVETCTGCHDWTKHSSHPLGEKVIDSRNKNLAMDCLSCHRSHGSGYRYLIAAPTPTDLCVQCHRQLRK